MSARKRDQNSVKFRSSSVDIGVSNTCGSNRVKTQALNPASRTNSRLEACEPPAGCGLSRSAPIVFDPEPETRAILNVARDVVSLSRPHHPFA
jgi:hypothetical protein